VFPSTTGLLLRNGGIAKIYVRCAVAAAARRAVGTLSMQYGSSVAK
jgi:hypothetical protein